MAETVLKYASTPDQTITATFQATPLPTSPVPTVQYFADSGLVTSVAGPLALTEVSSVVWTAPVPDLPAQTLYIDYAYKTEVGGVVLHNSDDILRLVAADVISGGTSITLDELKQHLQMDLTKTTNDVELLRFLRAAEKAIGHRTGPLVPEQRVEKHDGGVRVILLRCPVAISLISVTYADGTSSTLSDYDLDTEIGLLGWNFGTRGWFNGGKRQVTVTYMAGFSEVPEDLKQAVKELVRHLWETQRPVATSRTRTAASIDVTPNPGSYTSWPPRVQELVAPYVPLGVA
jgi:hypothetical protein